MATFVLNDPPIAVRELVPANFVASVNNQGTGYQDNIDIIAGDIYTYTCYGFSAYIIFAIRCVHRPRFAEKRHITHWIYSIRKQ